MSSTLKCRFYENEFPDVEDTVVANVLSIAEMGAYVNLSEYNNKEGMILLSELSRRRIRSVNKLIRIGRSECVVVMRVDKDKGYIDLSKRRVILRDQRLAIERFAKAKMINSILRHVAEQLGYERDEQLEQLYKKTAWFFDRKEGKKAAAYDAFKRAIIDPSVLDDCQITQEERTKLLEDIHKKLTPQAVKIRADIEVTCFGYEGIDAIKAALVAGKQCSTEAMPIKINLIAAPHFVVTTQTMDREGGLEAVKKALEVVKEHIEKTGGKMNIKEEPRVVTDVEDEKKKLGFGDEEELDEEESEGDESSTEDEDEDGLVAPAGLNEEADAADKERKKKKGDKKKKGESDEDDEEDSD
ncbi:hypothetical protein WR25_18334 [Diploscapter pachys]|uniref:Eukaryotic translation initiation factor 2 subunit 1 n=1 Tax=Diploscapter pachys TaxID=2018661 RepID=A0A2A2LXG4_9BILA|nr:hypothetical protein WR25_18334 [Diploscapter pachys]